MATSKQTTLQIRIDAKTKREAKAVLDVIGLDMSSAIKIFFRNIVITKSFPLELRTENGFTVGQELAMLADLAEANKNSKSYSSAAELFADINSETPTRTKKSKHAVRA